MNTKSIAIRTALRADARRLAAAHIACWKETYAGLIPDDTLDSLDLNARTVLWQNLISARRTRQNVFIALAGSRVVGFASCGPARDTDLSDWEVYTLYVRKSFQRRGIGTKLWKRCCLSLSRRGGARFHLWVLKANKSAVYFYKRVGGNFCATKSIPIGDQRFSGRAYRFEIRKNDRNGGKNERSNR